MSKHTPGPWLAFCGKAITQVMRHNQGSGDKTGSVLICHIAGAKDADIREFNGARWEADARLIAAAPDLLAALQTAHQFITNGIELGYIRLPSPGTPDPALKTPEIVRAAIAKATGAQS